MVRYQVSGTHSGEFMGVPATGRRLTWEAMMHARVKSGRVQESWLQWDRLAVMQQLGAMPMPG